MLPPSPYMKSIIKGLAAIQNGFKWRISDGSQILLWYDWWATDDILLNQVDHIMPDEVHLRLFDVINEYGY